MRYRRVFLPGASYFFTLVVHQRAPLFSDAFAIDLFTRAIRKVQTERPFTLEAQVILPDHVHLLWTLPEGDTDYPTRVRLIKATFTRLLLRSRPPAQRSHSRIAKGEQAVWQRRYWEHTIRDERDFQGPPSLHTYKSGQTRARERSARLALLDFSGLGRAWRL